MQNYTNPIYDYIYIDIETVGKSKDWETFQKEHPNGVSALERKWQNNNKGETIEEYFLKNSPLATEFNNIVCISVGVLSNKGGKMGYDIQSFYNSKNEKQLLEEFVEYLNETDKFAFCGFNSNYFDIPTIQRKCIKHGIKLPHQLKTLNKKPWEVKHFDLCDAWKGLGYVSSSLESVCFELQITPNKNNIYGKEVHNTFYDVMKDDSMEVIKDYCESDVLSTIKLCIKIIKANL